MKEVVSFPHMGSYHVPISSLFAYIFPHFEIRAAPPVTKRTLELGARHSPDFVCVPFKYNLGCFIEALDGGATTLIQAGGGCRYGYYGEIQEQILRDLGYEFRFVQFLAKEMSLRRFFEVCAELGSPRSKAQILRRLALTVEMLFVMDGVQKRVRENIGFSADKPAFEAAERDFLRALSGVNSAFALFAAYRRFHGQVGRMSIDKPRNCLKVGIVGELFTQMEPFSSFFVEKTLAEAGIAVSRSMNLTYLLIKKPLSESRILKKAGKYLRFHIGADGTGSVAQAIEMAKRGFDGIVHFKPFGCTPEVNAMPMLQGVSRDFGLPVLYFSFDEATSETGVQTRLEAFADMLQMRRDAGKTSVSGGSTLAKLLFRH